MTLIDYDGNKTRSQCIIVHLYEDDTVRVNLPTYHVVTVSTVTVTALPVSMVSMHLLKHCKNRKEINCMLAEKHIIKA